MVQGIVVCVVLVLSCLSGCSLLPNSDGVALETDLSLRELARRMKVHELDPRGTTPLLVQAFEQLERTDFSHQLKGVTYQLSDGNRLAGDWLVQTPAAWGLRAEEVIPGRSDALLTRIRDLVASAKISVDIALLQPPADERFLGALRKGIARLAASGRHVTVRILVGTYPPLVPHARDLIAAFQREVDGAPRSRVELYAAVMRSCDAAACKGLSWNHAKIVAVDGQRSFVGGHNMWTQDYLQDDPVHDLSMQVEGPAAADAHRFSDALWHYVCHHPAGDTSTEAAHYRAHRGMEKSCAETVALPPANKAQGGVRVLSIARLGKGIREDFSDQSLVARSLLFGAARSSIRLLQQDVAFAIEGVNPIWPDVLVDRMVDLILHEHGDVFMILSNLGAASPTGHYSNGVRLDVVAKHILDVAQKHSWLPRARIVDRLCQHLHLAPLRFGPDDAWADGKPIGVHAKLWIIDDRAFYIGSENLYPTNLQEFGYVLDDPKVVRELSHDLWEPAWRWSSRAAVSGSEARHCVLHGEPSGTLR